MSLPILTTLLLAGYIGGVRPAPTHLPSRPSPNCSGLCVDGHCMPVSVQELDDGYCGCGRMRMSDYSRHTFSVKQRENNTILIRWKKKIMPKQSVLLYLPVGEFGVCFNITAQEVPLYHNVKVECTHSDLISMDDNRFRLLNLESYQTIAVSKDNKANNRMISSTPMAPCRIPDNVFIRQSETNQLEVIWVPFVSGRDLRVSLLREENDIPQNEKASVWPVCRYHITSWTFNNLTPGSYKAMVGLHGCNVYRESDIFQLPEPYSTTTELSTTPSSPYPDPAGDMMSVSMYVVGVLAFICCTSFGIVCHKITVHWYPKRYKLVDPGYVNYSTKIIIAGNKEDKETADVISWIHSSLKQPHVEIETVGDLTLIARDEKHLLVVVSLQDVETFSEQALDAWPNNMSLSILTNYRSSVSSQKDMGPLLAYVPAGIPHLNFEGILNNQMSCSRILDIRDVLQHLNPGFKPHRPEVRRFLENFQDFEDRKRKTIRRIFLVSCGDHPHHVKACLELTKLIRRLGKDVICNLDEMNVHAIKDVRGWTTNQIYSSDLVLIVCSQSLYMMLESYGDLDLPANLKTQSFCAYTTIEVLLNLDCNQRVGILKLDHAEGHKDKIQELKFLSKSEEVYDFSNDSFGYDHKGNYLKGSRSGDIEHFLLTLTPDVSRVQKAISDSVCFFQTIEDLKALKGKDLKYDFTEASVNSSSVPDLSHH